MTESPLPVNERRKKFKTRSGAVAGMLTTATLIGSTGWILVSSGFHGEPTTAPRPTVTTPDTRPSPTVSPTITSTIPSVPDLPIWTVDACDTQNSPAEGSFGKNTGIHTLYASDGHPMLASVTPEISDIQQLSFKLPNQDQWSFFDPGVTGIVIQAETDIQVDTSNNRDVAFSGCGNGPDAVTPDVASRVQDEFDKFGFGYVDVVTVQPGGYVVQEVPQGQVYTPAIPSTFFPFNGS